MRQQKFEVVVEQNTRKTYVIKADNADTAREIAEEGIYAPEAVSYGKKNVLQVAEVPPRYEITVASDEYTHNYAVVDTKFDVVVGECAERRHARALMDALNEEEDAK